MFWVPYLVFWFLIGNLQAESVLEPSPPLQLTRALPIEINEENRQQILDNPTWVEAAMKYNEYKAEKKRFPWLELTLLSLLGLFLVALRYAPPFFPKQPETPEKRLARARKEALGKIAALQQKNWPLEQQSANLSSIVRQYIEDVYDIDAPKQTTEEFLGYALQDNRFDEETKNDLKNFLILTDKVKFSKSPLEKDQFNTISKTVYQFINKN